ncbi:hypothetical protein JHY03_72060 (plasmid) [Streptomyces sp. CA-256286]|nr:hypothetical protein JHY03_72060 [Streptomyces sp. CA-256286]
MPAEGTGCSGVTAWRRLRDEAGVWPRLHEVLLAELRKAGLLDMDDCAIDGSPIRALKGGSHRTFAGRPRPAGQQAPPDRRPPRHTPRRLADRREPARRHSADAPAGRDPQHPRPPRTASAPAGPAVRRPRLRLRQVPPHPPSPRHHTQDRPPRRPARLRAGQDTLGRRADLRLAPPVQTTPDPLRDTRRPPPRPAKTHLQHHLLETPTNLILKPSVTGSPGDHLPADEDLEGIPGPGLRRQAGTDRVRDQRASGPHVRLRRVRATGHPPHRRILLGRTDPPRPTPGHLPPHPRHHLLPRLLLSRRRHTLGNQPAPQRHRPHLGRPAVHSRRPTGRRLDLRDPGQPLRTPELENP